MKLKAGLCFAVLVIFGIHGNAQVLSTKEAKVILVVDETKETVSHIELFGNFQLLERAEVLEKYPNCRFYIGLLEGSYELDKNNVKPINGSTIIMYTDRQYLSNTEFNTGNKLSIGDQLDIGSIKTKVVSKKKGELILETQ